MDDRFEKLLFIKEELEKVNTVDNTVMEFKQFLMSKIDEFISKASELRDVPNNTVQEAGRALIEYLKLESDEKTKAADLAVEASSADTDDTEASNPWTQIKENFNSLCQFPIPFSWNGIEQANQKRTRTSS